MEDDDIMSFDDAQMIFFYSSDSKLKALTVDIMNTRCETHNLSGVNSRPDNLYPHFCVFLDDLKARVRQSLRREGQAYLVFRRERGRIRVRIESHIRVNELEANE